ncbi:MAG: hypothetical protein AAFX81_01165 [Pseudomonadota bacterium]
MDDAVRGLVRSGAMVAVIGVVVSVAATPAKAASVGVFSGTVTSITCVVCGNAVPDILDGTDRGLSPGDAYLGAFGFANDAVDVDPDPSAAFYEFGLDRAAFGFTNDVVTQRDNNFVSAELRVVDDGPDGDLFRFVLTNALLTDVYSIELRDPTGAALDGTTIPFALTADQFAERSFGYTFRDVLGINAAQLEGTVDELTLVPIPGALPLLLTALAGGVAWRRLASG